MLAACCFADCRSVSRHVIKAAQQMRPFDISLSETKFSGMNAAYINETGALAGKIVLKP